MGKLKSVLAGAILCGVCFKPVLYLREGLYINLDLSGLGVADEVSRSDAP